MVGLKTNRYMHFLRLPTLQSVVLTDRNLDRWHCQDHLSTLEDSNTSACRCVHVQTFIFEFAIDLVS